MQTPKNPIIIDRIELNDFVKKRICRMNFYNYQNPLCVAAEFNSKESLDFLIQNGANLKLFSNDVSRVSKFKNALQYAIKSDNLEMLQQILDISTKKIQQLEENFQDSACVYAAENDKFNALCILVEHYKKSNISHLNGFDNALTVACIRGNTEIAHYLLKNTEQNLNQISYQDLSPLMACCKFMCYEIFLELISSPKIDVNLRNSHGKTALYISCKYGTSEYIEHLLKHNSDPSISPYFSGKTALFVAIERGDEQIIHTLLKKCNISAFRRMTTYGITAWTLSKLYFLIMKIDKEI